MGVDPKIKVVAAFNQEKALRDYDPSDGPFCSTSTNRLNVMFVKQSAMISTTFSISTFLKGFKLLPQLFECS